MEVIKADIVLRETHSPAVYVMEMTTLELAIDRNLMVRVPVAVNPRKIYLRMLRLLLCLSLVLPAVAIDDSDSRYRSSYTPEWYDCGGSSWYQGYDKDNKSVLRSGPIECTGHSRICAKVTGPATISFLWKSEVTNQMVGQLSFLVDDTKYMCDSSGWTPISYSIWDNETHELMWEFRKIKCYPKNIGAGWIGNVFIEYGDSRFRPDSRIYDSILLDSIKRNITNETIILSSNITIYPGSVTIVSPEVEIPSARVVMNTSGLQIMPSNIFIDASEIKINSRNATFCMNHSDDKDKDERLPNLILTSPKCREHLDLNSNISFKYVPESNEQSEYCALYINGAEVLRHDYPYNSAEYEFIREFNKSGNYTWSVKCCYDSSRCNGSENRTIVIKPNIAFVTGRNDAEIHHYSSIIDALENISSGGTIYVNKSNCSECVILNKSVNLIGIKSNESYPIIDGMVTIDSSYVLINGFEINAINSNSEYGISTYLKEEHGPNTDMFCPTTSTPPEPPYYTNITISNNTIIGGSKDGISLARCKNISIENNILINPGMIGFRLSDCVIADIHKNEIKSDKDIRKPSKSFICLGGCSNISIQENNVSEYILVHNFNSTNMSFCNNNCGGAKCSIANFGYSLKFAKRDFVYASYQTLTEVINKC